MTRNDHRAQCIEAMVHIIHPSFDSLNQDQQQRLRKAATKYLDALHGIARVVPIEATEEMRATSLWNQPKHQDYVEHEWRLMSACGDLTNPPETKP